MLQAKIHRAVVTQADLHYVGSISICRALMEASGILPGQQVDVLNITNGNRLTTYAIAAERETDGQGRGTIGINGAAAHLVSPEDLVIICTYASMPAQEAKSFQPTVVIVDEANRVV